MRGGAAAGAPSHLGACSLAPGITGSACRTDAPRPLDAFEATSLHTLVQMVDNGLGTTLLPQLALDAGILKGTTLMATPLAAAPPRQIALAWRKGTGRAPEFRLLAEKISAQRRAKP